MRRHAALFVSLFGGAATSVGCTGPNPAYYHRGSGDAAAVDATAPLADDASGAPETPPPPPIDGGVSAALANGLVGFWTMEQPAQGLVANDSSGGAHHGTLEGFPARPWVPGRRGGTALEVAGATNPETGVRVGRSTAIGSIQSFTIAAWIFITDNSVDDFRSILSRQLDDTDNDIFNLTIVRGHLKIFVPIPPNDVAYSSTSPQLAPKNRWLHVAATLGGGYLRVYEDGQETDNTQYTRPLPPSTAPLYIGTNKNTPASGSEPFVGFVDDLLLYNTALPPAQIRDLAAGLLPPTVP